MAIKKQVKGSIANRRAKFDYELSDSFVVGLELTGAETKSLRMGYGDLAGAYVNVLNNELWLVNAKIHGTKGIPIIDDAVSRTRKLLAKRSEIEKLQSARQSGNTIVPVEILTKGRFVKIRISIGRGKKKIDKREIIKKRDQERESRRAGNA